MHGANLIAALKKERPLLEINAWGGLAMEKEGATILKNYNELAFMGFWEVAKNIFTIKKNFNLACQQILDFKPAVVVLIDYGGFNMKIAHFCKQNNIKVSFYISPKIWAWNTSRAYKIKATVDQMLCIFPFEVDFYKKFDYHQAFYVGNPLVDELSKFTINNNFISDNQLNKKPILAILAGSRTQEVERILPTMLAATDLFPQYQVIIAGVDNLPATLYKNALNGREIPVIYNQTYQTLSHADLALVTSGTATLETALLNTPQVVCYKANGLSYFLGKLLVKIKFISLVNLIAQKQVVTELIQQECSVQNIVTAIKKIEKGTSGRANMHNEYISLKKLVGSAGASTKAARMIIQLIS